METCYKAVRGDPRSDPVYPGPLRPGARTDRPAGAMGARIYEVPISYHGRTYAEGKNIGWRDGVKSALAHLQVQVPRHESHRRGVSGDEAIVGPRHPLPQMVVGAIRRSSRQRVIEVNAGPGHSTSHLIDREMLLVTDTDPVHVETLVGRFGRLENVDVRLHDFQIHSTDPDGFDTAILFDGLQRAAQPKPFWKVSPGQSSRGARY